MQSYAELGRIFTGPIVRDNENYWSKWVRSETGDSGVVLLKCSPEARRALRAIFPTVGYTFWQTDGF